MDNHNELIDPKHLFLLSPPLSGSGAMAQLMKTSPNVTVFPGQAEGQFLPEARSILLTDQRWNPDYQIDWKHIKQIFLSHWSPLKPIRFEKSPPLLVKALELEQVFENAYFLITIRNPYAQIEGVLRRGWPFDNLGPLAPPASAEVVKNQKGVYELKLPESLPSPPPPPATPAIAAEFWVRTARFQKRNMEQLRHSCFYRYEELLESTDTTISKILEYLPDINYVNTETEFTVHNVTGKPIIGLKNLNQQKIDNLSETQMAEINQVLYQHQDILDFFQYRIIDK